MKNKALVHQCVFPLERHAMQVDERLRVHEDAHIVILKDAIPFARLGIEPDDVGEAGTASALNAEAQTALVGCDSFFRQRRANVLQRLGRDDNALRRRRFNRGWCYFRGIHSTFLLPKMPISGYLRMPAQARQSSCWI